MQQGARVERKEEGAQIRETWFATLWPQYEEEKESRLVHYTSKGQETHTRLPRAALAELLPASFLVMGLIRKDQEYTYECLTIDSANADRL